MRAIVISFLLAISVDGTCGARALGATQISDALPTAIKVDRAIVFSMSERKTTKGYVFDPDWLQQLAAILEKATFTPQSHCFCSSYPRIELYHQDVLILTLSVHHMDTLRLSSRTGTQDFGVGTDVAKSVVELAKRVRVFEPPRPELELKAEPIPLPPLPPIRANKSLQPTATAVMPPAAQEIMPAVAVAEH
jgi:hypothetical protein